MIAALLLMAVNDSGPFLARLRGGSRPPPAPENTARPFRATPMSLRTRGPRGPARRHVPDLCGPAPLHLPDLCQTQVPVPLADGREAAPPALPPARQRRFEAYSRLRRGVYHITPWDWEMGCSQSPMGPTSIEIGDGDNNPPWKYHMR